MAFKKGEINSTGRKKGSKNKANILTEALDQVYEKEIGSGDGASMFLEKNFVNLIRKINNDELTIDQCIKVVATLAPYYGSKNTSTVSQVTKTDNTISGKMVRELNEARMEMQKLKSELKEARRKKLPSLTSVS